MIKFDKKHDITRGETLSTCIIIIKMARATIRVENNKSSIIYDGLTVG